MSKAKILFLTTSSISTNPRLLKSYLFWSDEGYECQVLAFRMNNWSDNLDDELTQKYKINIINIPGSKQAYSFWLKSSLLNKVLSYFKPSLLPTKYLAYASNKRTWQLIQYLRNKNLEFDHIEAHTLGALYPAYYWAKRYLKPFSFDVEDFHPEEKISHQKETEKERRYSLMKKLLPAAKYITAAAPLIAEETENLIHKKVITINNSFPEADFKIPSITQESRKLQLIWFSQHISFGRGLEEFIEIAWTFKEELDITLIGQLNPDFDNEIIKPKQDFIQVKRAMPQAELHVMLADYDVGLALEDGNEDYNRQICLTNKIWAYFQAGLYILATETKAQIEFIRPNTSRGQLITLEREKLINDLALLIKEKQLIKEAKEKRFTRAKGFAFEKETEKMKELIL